MMGRIRILQACRGDLSIKVLQKSLIDALKKEGFIVESACSVESQTARLRKEGYVVHPIGMRKTDSLIIAGLSFVKYAPALYKLIKRGKYHVVHTYNPVVGLLGNLIARLAKVPIVIYSLQGFYFAAKMHTRKWRIYYLLERMTLKLAHCVLFASQEDCQLALRRRIVSPASALYTGNGIDIHKFSQTESNRVTRRTLGLNSDHMVVVTVARLVWEKGYKELLEAMAMVCRQRDDVRLCIAGDGGDKNEIQSYSKKLRLEQYVTFLGAIDYVAELLSIADIFVLPSYREGLPYAVIEAMVSGKGVIATNIRGCRELIVNGVTGLLVPMRDSQALSQAILRGVTDKELMAEMGRRGRERAVSSFDERVVIGRQIEKYKELIANLQGDSVGWMRRHVGGLSYNANREATKEQ